jgi:hypothetical protein
MLLNKMVNEQPTVQGTEEEHISLKDSYVVAD